MITVAVKKVQQVVKGHNLGHTLTNHHSHLKEKVQQLRLWDLSKMGVDHINATLVGGGVIAGVNAHPGGPGLEGFKRIQTSSKVPGKGSQKSKETINGGTLEVQGEGEERYYNPNPKV